MVAEWLDPNRRPAFVFDRGEFDAVGGFMPVQDHWRYSESDHLHQTVALPLVQPLSCSDSQPVLS